MSTISNHKASGTLDANESSSTFTWNGGPAIFLAEGTWDTSTVSLEMTGDADSVVDASATWLARDSSTTVTANAVALITLAEGRHRVTMSSVGASSDVNWAVVPAGDGT